MTLVWMVTAGTGTNTVSLGFPVQDAHLRGWFATERQMRRPGGSPGLRAGRPDYSPRLGALASSAGVSGLLCSSPLHLSGMLEHSCPLHLTGLAQISRILSMSNFCIGQIFKRFCLSYIN